MSQDTKETAVKLALDWARSQQWFAAAPDDLIAAAKKIEEYLSG